MKEHASGCYGVMRLSIVECIGEFFCCGYVSFGRSHGLDERTHVCDVRCLWNEIFCVTSEYDETGVLTGRCFCERAIDCCLQRSSLFIGKTCRYEIGGCDDIGWTCLRRKMPGESHTTYDEKRCLDVSDDTISVCEHMPIAKDVNCYYCVPYIQKTLQNQQKWG